MKEHLYVVKLDAGMCGTTSHEFVIADASVIEDAAYELAVQHHESYGESYDEDIEPEYDYQYELVQEDFKGSLRDAHDKYGCASQYI